MWTILVRAAATGVFGSAFGKWFLKTRMGVWFQYKLETYLNYLANKYNIKIAKKSEKWKSDYPIIAGKIDEIPKLKTKIAKLEEEIETLKSDSSGVKRVVRKKKVSKK